HKYCYIAYILYCKIGVHLDSEKDGWTNQNYIHIDEIKGGTLPTCMDWGIYMDTHTRFQPNQNFFSGSIEGAINNGSIYIGGGVNNVFTGLRFETPGNTNNFQLENSTFSGSSSDFNGLPLNNFVYGAGSNQISWGNVTGAAKKRDALLFYGSINSDLYNQNHLFTSLKIDRKLGVGTESPSAKLEVNKLRESSGNAIARFGYDKDSIGTRLEIWIDPASQENVRSDLDMFASYSRNGADFHIGTIAKKRMMTFLNQTSNTRVGVNQELPAYELDVNGTINALSYLVDGVPLAQTLSRNATDDTPFSLDNTNSDTDEEDDNGGIDITRLYNMTKMITDPVIKETTAEVNTENQNNNVRYLFSIEELEENFPELVYADEDSQKKSVDYISFIPLMAKKLREQEEKIKQLEAILIGEGANTDIFASENDGGSNSGAKLYQNVPNPNNLEAEINVFIPERIETAKLMIFDLQGKKLKEIIINERNQHTIRIVSGDFSSGMYLYSLVADGNLIDTKRMIIDN
ncbi:MAG: T9SS type A sorting domain-containing protein, partial [Bacteroidota bacterium]